MKRNKTNYREPKSGTAPYTRYNKVPFVYSGELRAWERDNGRRESTIAAQSAAATRARNERRRERVV